MAHRQVALNITALPKGTRGSFPRMWWIGLYKFYVFYSKAMAINFFLDKNAQFGQAICILKCELYVNWTTRIPFSIFCQLTHTLARALAVSLE